MTFKGIFSTCCFILLTSLWASAQSKEVTEGDLAVKDRNYEKAITLFKKAVAENASDIITNEKLAAAYLAAGDYADAETAYQKLAANTAANKMDKFYYAQALRDNDKYDLAAKAYLDFSGAMPNNPLAAEFKHFGDLLPELLLDRDAFTITNLPENSPASDIGPALGINELYITSARNNENAVKNRDLLSSKNPYDIYLLPTANKAAGTLPDKIKSNVNGKLTEGPLALTRNGKEMIFTRTNYNNKAADGSYKLGLYNAVYDSEKGKWNMGEPVAFINYNYNMAQPSLSKDGSRLYFVSDMPGGFGGTDIYVSGKTGNTWATPVNLGSEINTAGNEMFPFISDKGKLFFSSDSRVGLGGLDIYIAANTNGQWGDVRNPGAPFNSSYDDFGFVCDEQQLTGYFVSNRPGGKGSDDIYKFVKKTQSICGQVLDKYSKLPLANAAIEFISVGGDNAQTTSNKTGGFCVSLESGLGYFVKVSVNGYLKYEAMMQVNHTDNPMLVVGMEPKGGISLTVNIIKDNHAVPNADVTLLNINSGETEHQNGNSSGVAQFDITPKQFYNITVAGNPNGLEPYKESSRTLSTTGKKLHDSLSINITCAANTIFNTGGFPNLFFSDNKFDIGREAERSLANIVSQMMANPTWQLEISGYSDWAGTEQNNPSLATQRATGCLNYLASHGVDKGRLTAIGYGDKSAAGNQNYPLGQNRRVEFKLIK